MAKIKLKKTKYDFIILDRITKIKVVNVCDAEKIVILHFNGNTYLIDDTHNQQEVNIYPTEDTFSYYPND